MASQFEAVRQGNLAMACAMAVLVWGPENFFTTEVLKRETKMDAVYRSTTNNPSKTPFDRGKKERKSCGLGGMK